MLRLLLILAAMLGWPALAYAEPADPAEPGPAAHEGSRATVLVGRELHFPSPAPGVACWLTASYAGPGLERVETLSESTRSDAYRHWRRRRSDDNGKTWSPPSPIDGVVRETDAGGIVEYPSSPIFDPQGKHSYRFFMVRQWPGLPCYTYDAKHGRPPYVDHVLVSEDGGPPRLLRYEEGADWNPQKPFDPAYLHANKAYMGNAPAFAPDGTAYYPVCVPAQGTAGVILFRRDPASGEWRASNGRSIPAEVSSRGLMEPEAAVLRDGRILVVCRGSNTAKTPGRKWRMLSDDGGKTLGPVEELRYDDGSQFYSPSSIHRFLRSSRNGKLYWFANICPEPPRGNLPRYPLYMAEIDEEKAAVRKESLVMLDTRRPGEPERLQLSNFCVLEDRPTGNIEVYITLLGLDAKDVNRAGVYRYVVSP